MDNRKNTILLTVIAVATLLVAVVGATFAYFTAQQGNAQSANVEVTTDTAASSMISVSGAISLHATPDNFNEAAGSHLNSDSDAYGKITWRPSNTAGAETDYCYTVTLNITDNDTEYDPDGGNVAELLFNIEHSTTAYAGQTDGRPASVTEPIIENIENLTYTTVTTTDTGSRPEISGWDITGKTGSFLIRGDQTDGSWKITGNSSQDTNEYWHANVTMVNLDRDQLYNTGKSVTGTLTFNNGTCD